MTGDRRKDVGESKGGEVSLFSHCNIRFRSYVIWYLSDNRDFFNRKLKIGLCPKCYTLVVELEETRKVDNRVFYDIRHGQKADSLKNKLTTEKLYTSLDLLPGVSRLFGFRYGINKEKFNKEKGVYEIEQYSCDFYGNKELIKRV